MSQAETLASAAPLRVLLIDDHALFRAGLRELLERRGIVVIDAVGDSGVGLRLARDQTPDVVLLDLRMPGRNGIEILHDLRQANPQALVAMLTTSADERDVLQAIQGGARGYLLKDMEPDELIEALQQIVAGGTAVARELTGVLAKAVQGGGADGQAAFGLLGPDPAGDGDPLSPGRRAQQQGDQQGAGHYRWYGQAAREGYPAQTRRPLPGRGRGHRRGAGALRTRAAWGGRALSPTV